MRLIRQTFLIIGLSLILFFDGLALGGAAVKETIWLIPGKDIFLCGEDIIVSLAILEADSYATSDLSKMVNLELLNDKGVKISSSKHELSEGKAFAAIPVSSKLPSGWYYIRAYTRWMQNFSNSNFAVYPVKIVNPSELSKIHVSKENKPDRIKIVPEWGSLAANRTNSCAFFIKDKNGNGMATTVYLINALQDTIARLVSDETGWGKFDWIPKKNENYSIIMDSENGHFVKCDFPKITETDVLFEIKEDNSGLNVSCSGITGSDLEFVVHGTYTSYWTSSGRVVGNKSIYTIPFSDLPNGIVQLSFFSETGEFVAGRLYSKEREKPIIEPEITFSKTNPKMHDNVDVAFNFPEIVEKDKTNLVNIKVGVSPQKKEATIFKHGMKGWWASSKIPIQKEAFESWLIGNLYENDIPNGLHSNKADFIDDTNLPDVEKLNTKFEFVPETRGVVISGKVIDDNTGDGMENIGVSVSMKNSKKFYSARTFINGSFHFTFPDYSSTDVVTVAFTYKVPPSYVIQLTPEFDERKVEFPQKDFALSLDEINYVRQTNVLNQLERIYASEADTFLNEKPSVTRDSLPFFGIPDLTISINKYIALLNLREIVFEVVPYVYARKKGKSYNIVVVGEKPYPYNFNPLILIDGIPYPDHDKILNLEPRKISYIDVKQSLYIHGNTGFAGIVSFRSKNNDMARLKLPEGSRTFRLRKPEPNYKFKPHIAGDKTIALRNTLAFKLLNVSDKTVIPLLTNDLFGQYSCIVSGFDKNGNWIWGAKSFTVNDNFNK